MSSLSTKEQSIGKGFVILSAANIIVKILSLLFIPFLNRILGGEAGYSVYYSANQVFAFVYVLTTAGLPVAISKLVTELTSTGNRKQAFQSFKIARTIMVIIGFVLAAFMIAFAKPIARAMNNEDSWMGILVLAPTVMICSLLSAYRGYLQGMKNMTPTAISQVAEQIVHVVVSIVMVLVLRSRGIIWAVAGASVGTAVGALVALIIVIKYYRQYENDYKTSSYIDSEKILSRNRILALIFHYSIPITISSGIQYGGNMIDTSIMRGRLEVAGLSEYVSQTLHGMMGVTRQLLNVPTALVTSLCISLLPVIAGLYAQRKYQETQEKANYAFKLCYIVAVPMAVAMCVFSKPLYVMLGLGDGSRLLSTMSFSVILLGIVHLQSSVMQSVNQLYRSTFFMAIGILTKAVLNYVLIAIPALNIYGAVIATYASYIIPLVFNHISLKRKKNIKISLFKSFLLPATCSILMLVGAVPVYLGAHLLFDLFLNSYLADTVSLILAAITGVILYVITMRKTGGMTSEDLDLILPAKVRRKLKL